MRPLPPAVRERRVGALFDGRLSEARRRSIVRVCNEGSFWQADHVLAVANGGGESGLENSQTLCTPCHKEKTAEEHSGGRYGGARGRRARSGRLRAAVESCRVSVRLRGEGAPPQGLRRHAEGAVVGGGARRRRQHHGLEPAE